MSTSPQPGRLWLVPCKEHGFADEIGMGEIPADPGDGETVAHELNHLLQRAYDIGRKHQLEICERDMLALQRTWKKQHRGMR